MNITIQKTLYSLALSLLISSSLVVSMDLPQNNTITLCMPHPTVKSLTYLSPSKCAAIQRVFPHHSITPRDTFIALTALSVSPEQAKIINASPDDLFVKGTEANKTLKKLDRNNKQFTLLPSKIFNDLKDGDQNIIGATLGAGFNNYKEACTKVFAQEPCIDSRESMRFLVRQKIVNKNGSHGIHSDFAKNTINP